MSDESNAIRWKGTITEQLYLRAVRLHTRQGLTARVFLSTFFVMMVVGAFASYFYYGESFGKSAWPLLVIAAWFLLLRLAPTLGVKRAYKTHLSLRSELSGSASGAGVEISSETGVSKLPWSQYYRALIADDLILLYQAAQLFQMVSKSWFVDENDWRAFTELVRANAPRPRRSVFTQAWTAVQWIAVAVMVAILIWAVLG